MPHPKIQTPQVIIKYTQDKVFEFCRSPRGKVGIYPLFNKCPKNHNGSWDAIQVQSKLLQFTILNVTQFQFYRAEHFGIVLP